jgi:hypothetical protein
MNLNILIRPDVKELYHFSDIACRDPFFLFKVCKCIAILDNGSIVEDKHLSYSRDCKYRDIRGNRYVI